MLEGWKETKKGDPLPRSEEEPGHVVVVTEEKSGESPEDEVNTFIPDERLELSVLGKGEILVDLEQYVVLTVWIERDPDYNDPKTNWWIHPEKKHECDYRYYWDKDHISFMRHQQEEGKEEIATEKIADGDVVKGMDTIQDKAAQERFQEINRDYVVIHQKIGFHGWSTIQEVRRYSDNREELWFNKNGRWYDNTPRVPHKDSVPRVIPRTWKDGKYI